MTEALDSEIRPADGSPGAAAPAALACPWRSLHLTCIRQYVLVLWDAAPRFACTLSTTISLVLLAALAVLLTQELTERTVTIQPTLAGDRHISGVAAHCCNALPTHL